MKDAAFSRLHLAARLLMSFAEQVVIVRTVLGFRTIDCVKYAGESSLRLESLIVLSTVRKEMHLVRDPTRPGQVQACNTHAS